MQMLAVFASSWSFEAAEQVCADPPESTGGAARLLGAADGILKTLNMAMMPIERALYEQTLQQTRELLDPDAFSMAWAEGEKMTIEQAISYANCE